MNWSWPVGIYVNEAEGSCPEGNSKMTFAFEPGGSGAPVVVPPGNPAQCEILGQPGTWTTRYLCAENAQGKCCKEDPTKVCLPTGQDPGALILTDETNCPSATHKCTTDLQCICKENCTSGRTQDRTDCSCTCPSGVWSETQEACVECVSNANCTGGKVCDTTDNKCKCPDCPASGMSQSADTCACTCNDNKVLNDAGNACVECKTNSDCKNAVKPVCNTENNTCVECSEDADCADRADGKTTCDTANNTCKCPDCSASGMTQDENTCACNCPNGKVLNADGTACVECKTNADCKDATKPVCTNNVCRPIDYCETHDNCSSYQYCNKINNKCAIPSMVCDAADCRRCLCLSPVDNTVVWGDQIASYGLCEWPSFREECARIIRLLLE